MSSLKYSIRNPFEVIHITKLHIIICGFSAFWPIAQFLWKNRGQKWENWEKMVAVFAMKHIISVLKHTKVILTYRLFLVTYENDTPMKIIVWNCFMKSDWSKSICVLAGTFVVQNGGTCQISQNYQISQNICAFN